MEALDGPQLAPGSMASPIAHITKPMANDLGDVMKFYYNSDRAASMYRQDGKKLAFVFNIHGTRCIQDIKYLDNEIADGHPNLREATVNEVDIYKMRVDPSGTLRSKIENEVSADVEAKVTARLIRELESAATGEDGKPLAPAEAMSAKLAALKAKNGVGVRTASVKTETGSAQVLQGHAGVPYKLGGIVSTDNLRDVASSSVQK